MILPKSTIISNLSYIATGDWSTENSTSNQADKTSPRRSDRVRIKRYRKPKVDKDVPFHLNSIYNSNTTLHSTVPDDEFDSSSDYSDQESFKNSINFIQIPEQGFVEEINSDDADDEEDLENEITSYAAALQRKRPRPTVSSESEHARPPPQSQKEIRNQNKNLFAPVEIFMIHHVNSLALTLVPRSHFI
ncbi:hypothetical protein OCU04_008647 [Sclerotinia nivalis]|uniref:Uncharacterized protein n=1 Tax=Sclerotinia nivalis TaxID=352851 RepID=A0A9X0AJJ4_9HELO|nr:hypothetical protein OCU04_008647 [Sclerotinia nivalis]